MLVGGGGLIAYLRLRAEVKQITASTNQINAQAQVSEADAAVKIGEAWSALITPLNQQLASQHVRINELVNAVKERDVKIAHLEMVIAKLTGLLQGKGLIVVSDLEKLVIDEEGRAE